MQNSQNKNSSKIEIIANPSDIILAATTLALTLSNGKNKYELETLINLFSLTTDNLQSILAQTLTNQKTPTEIQVTI